jgi:hypothetical protein
LSFATVAASSDWINATIKSTVRSKSARSMVPLCAWVERAGTKTVVTGYTDVVQLDRAGIVAETGDEIELQRNLPRGSDFFYVGDQLAVGQLAEGVEHHARPAAQHFLRGFGARTRNVVRNSYF